MARPPLFPKKAGFAGVLSCVACGVDVPIKGAAPGSRVRCQACGSPNKVPGGAPARRQDDRAKLPCPHCGAIIRHTAEPGQRGDL